jgi:membrane-associated protease RseP (regulator of RpoE activity)
MYALFAIVSLAVGGAIGAAFAVGGRWAAALPFGERSFRNAYRTPAGAPPPSLALALARAAGGVVGWYLAGSFLVGCSFFAGGEMVTDEQSMRVHVGGGGAAEAAGIKNGDRVLAVDGADVHDWDGLRRAVSSRGGATVSVEVDRDGERLSIPVTPRGAPPKLMVGPPTSSGSVGIGRAAALGAKAPGTMGVATARAFGRMLTGADPAEVTGPAGMVSATADAQRQGPLVAAKLVAMLVCYFLPYVIALSLVLAIVSASRRRATR